MTLEIERAEKLANYLTADPQRGKMLLESPVEEALAAINADGNDFTIEELKAFDQAMVAASSDGELFAENLDCVAGGINFPLIYALAVRLGAIFARWFKNQISKAWS